MRLYLKFPKAIGPICILLLMTIALATAACTTPTGSKQTPQQVAKEFCAATSPTLSDLKLLDNLTPEDYTAITKVSDTVGVFCTGADSETVDLQSLNANVTQVALKILNQSTIPNKDKYEIAIVVAQGAVTAYLASR